MTDETFAEIIVVLEAAYGADFSAEKRRAWRLLIDDLPDDTARQAAIRVCRTSSYPPKPADIVKAVLGDPRDSERLLDEEAEAALVWMEAEFTDCEIVDYGTIINAAMRALGGPDVIGTLMVKDEWKFHRDEFRNLYKVFRRRVEGAGPPIPQNVTESIHKGHAMPPSRAAVFGPPPIPGLPALPGRLSLPVEVTVDGESRGSELAVPANPEGGNAE